ncbi:ribosome biogenesis GTP-binding protein YlqF [Alicyclobacillus acidocaldarius subsp. acidocaldarius DSM 446]|uniref:Ribosome biogenesis GTPase A n=1 Tax=Alicyclobacillus acidocaldarius subsp. acidocaldarius (strain ATCC 27009 / DSM 446 / BCRC 14685 / JCM 5260 / KCTC 1825 / NBRC 15652 / NCIMB 11725 / NRRL B-14509 / 104-IA) TaxID=521098 RepID=C8WWC3_ALIAD|nr:ribosome biogenesis GTP-binding protein YlqF [Alicyclobacillus acidocaldarius subsp. acidocaldarius DSM 446]
MPIQWFPGHMAKAKRLMAEELRGIDVVVELADARLPVSSRSPVLDELARNKPRLMVLTRVDLADPHCTEQWVERFQREGVIAIPVNARTGQGLREFRRALDEFVEAKMNRARARGIERAVTRGMICGIPNVGKSTFVNQLAGRAVAKTGDRPGVTRSLQWIRVGRTELLDTPGVLAPKLANDEQGLKLAASGAVKEEIFEAYEVCAYVLAYLSGRYPDALAKRYGLRVETPIEWTNLQDVWPAVQPWFEHIGRARGALVAGGAVDEERVAKMVIRDFQEGRLGPVSLEWPED